MGYAWAFCLAASVTLTSAQVPGFGWCPDYQPMTNFDMSKYLGTWYEAERMFTLTEAGARCVTSTYTGYPDGRVRVSNQVLNRLGLTRQLDGDIKLSGKAGEGKISVKYSSLPVPIDSEYMVLDTDYKTYSVVWSCSSIGPIVNRQNAWIMTRERLPPGLVLQRAYGVLDAYKIRRTFFVKTEQENCDYNAVLPAVSTTAPEAAPPAPAPAAAPAAVPASPPASTQPVAAPAETPAAPSPASRRIARETMEAIKEESSGGRKKPVGDTLVEKRPASKPDKAPNKKTPAGAV